jgi:hypothetical protein
MDVFVKGRSKVVLREVVGIPRVAKVVPRQENRRSPRSR